MRGGMGQPGSPFGGGQPPWMSGRSERDGRNEGDRNERTLGMLRSMDTNGNGILDANEVPEYRKRFVDMMVSQLGGDPNKPVNLKDLAKRTASSNTSSSSSSTPRSSGSTSSSSKSKEDPLVPAFGEKEVANTPVLEFGQREPAVKTAAVSSSAAAISSSDRILRQAREIMNRYDKNKNGTLDKDKGEWAGSLPFNADKSDKNRDGRVSMAELISALGGQSGASTGAAAVATKSSTPYDRLPPGMPDWFIERDKNQDAQLSMMEYANGQPWSEAIAAEFGFLDKNNDGTATVSEVFETLKQVDEEKRLKEEQAQRERERRQGAVSSTAVQPPPAGTEGLQTPQPEGGQPPQAPPAAGTPSAPPSSTPPAPQATPNWQPGSSSAVPASPPSTAPYSSGSSSNNGTSRYGSSSRSSRYGRSR
ncbi:hypothetical protein FACS1894214_1920 [Planctomycetales bacterium]|nr:hypothetical protein FACS1894214_1920 [Planctomycetales bacterium]